jgi:integrase
MQHERERSAERTMTRTDGHASVAVTAHTHADLFDDELDNIAALDSHDDVGQ